MSGGIERAHRDHRLRVRPVRRRFHIAQSPRAVLCHAPPIHIPLPYRDRILGLDGSLRFWLFRRNRCTRPCRRARRGRSRRCLRSHRLATRLTLRRALASSARWRRRRAVGIRRRSVRAPARCCACRTGRGGGLGSHRRGCRRSRGWNRSRSRTGTAQGRSRSRPTTHRGRCRRISAPRGPRTHYSRMPVPPVCSRNSGRSHCPIACRRGPGTVRGRRRRCARTAEPRPPLISPAQPSQPCHQREGDDSENQAASRFRLIVGQEVIEIPRRCFRGVSQVKQPARVGRRRHPSLRFPSASHAASAPRWQCLPARGSHCVLQRFPAHAAKAVFRRIFCSTLCATHRDI